MPTKKTCKFCEAEITPQMVFGSTVICDVCGLVETKQSSRSLFAKLIFGLVTISSLAGFGFYIADDVKQAIDPKSAYDKMSETQLLNAQNKCPSQDSLACELEIFRRLTRIDSTNVVYAANFAFKLTLSHQYKEADPIYKDVLAKGEGTYDLMYYYGRNLDGLEQTAEAVKWYEKSLAIASNNISIVESLAADYVKQKNPMSALSVLRSFVLRYPSAKGSLSGKISSILELVTTQPAEDSSRVTISSVDRGHFSIPVSVGESSPRTFIVDTGATIVSMPTSDAELFFRELMGRSRRTRARVADGRTIDMHLLTVPELQVGPWKFRNVEVAYCDTCDRLAGMSLLKKFKMQTTTKSGLSKLTLTRE